MQPLNSNIKKHSKVESRVKMIIRAKLSWLEGFPMALEGESVSWYCLNPLVENQNTISVTGNHLSKSVRAIKTLKREYPKALPRVVGDVGKWESAFSGNINLIKPYLHSEADVIENLLLAKDIYSKSQTDFARTIIEQHAELAFLLQALSWTFYTNKKQLDKVLKWLVNNGDYIQELMAIDFSLALNMSIFASGHSNGIEVLKDLVSENMMSILPSTVLGEYARVIARNVKKGDVPLSLPQTPKNTAKESIEWFANWLFNQEVKTQKQALKLLSVVELDRHIKPYHQWWNRVNNLSLHFVSISRAPSFGEDKKKRKELGKKMIALAETAPKGICFPDLLNAIAFLSKHEKRANIVFKLLKKVAQCNCEAVSSLSLIIHFRHVFGAYEEKFSLYLTAFNAYLSNSESTHLTPWEGLDSNKYYSSPEYNVLDIIKNNAHIKLFFDALGESIQKIGEGVNASETPLIATLITQGYQPVRIAALLANFHRNQYVLKYAYAEHLKIAGLLDNGVDQDFFKVVKKLDSLDLDEDAVYESLEDILKTFSSSDNKDLFRRLFVGNQTKSLIENSYKVRLIRQLKKNVPKLLELKHSKQEWIKRYPLEFQDVLERLAFIDDDAEKMAEKVLSRYYPSTLALQEEISFLKQKLASGAVKEKDKLAKRLESLELRLNQKPNISNEKINNILSKLHSTLDVKHYGLWSKDLDLVFFEVWREFFAIDEGPDWLYEPLLVKLLVPVTDLNLPDQKIARRIIKRRVESDVWDFRDEKPNQQFIQRMSAKGIHMQPWVDGIGEIEYPSGLGDGEYFCLRMEDDPLEVINMGGYFDTCLSPGAFNFFSVFANIADINKRVIYARDAQQRVVGRVLIALTNSGGILVFYRYCYNKKSAFDEMVKAFVTQLARQMQTIIVYSGDVPTLVAQNWYDDGPIDIGAQFEFLKKGSDFRKALNAVTPKDFIPLVQEQFSPIEFNELTLPLVISLSELENNPQLALPLADTASQTINMPVHIYIRLLELAIKADKADECFALLEKPVLQGLQRHNRQHRWINEYYLDVIVQCHPSKGLKLLRETRDKGVRSWKDEYFDRKKIAIKAYKLLGRDKQADKIQATL